MKMVRKHPALEVNGDVRQLGYLSRRAMLKQTLSGGAVLAASPLLASLAGQAQQRCLHGCVADRIRSRRPSRHGFLCLRSRTARAQTVDFTGAEA